MNALLEKLLSYAEQRPEAIAFGGADYQGAPAQLTYAQLLEQVANTAIHLQQLGIKACAMCAENSLNWVIVDLAAMFANVVLVPIPTFFSQEQIEHSLYDAGIDYLIGDWSSQTLENSNHIGQIAGFSLYQRPSGNSVKYPLGTGKITFTSGSTGTPKGVCLSHEHLVQVAQTLANALPDTQGPHLALLPLSTLLENITAIYVPLLFGVPAVIELGKQVGLLGSSQFDARTFAQALASHQPASLVLTPALLMALIQVVQAQPLLATPLQFVAVGGANVSAELIQLAHQSGIPVYEGYGLSECGSVVSLNTPNAHLPGSCGKPLSHSQVRIAEDGELLVRKNLALGYLHQPFTAEVLIDGEWLATGDLATLDAQGFLHLMGRKKNLIITAFGRNISPEWIESKAQPMTAGAPFVVVGDGQTALCAVSLPDAQLPERIAQLNQRLPDYARIRYLLLLDDPKTWQNWYTANGKPKRDQIERDAASLLQQAFSDPSLAATPSNNIDIIDLDFTAQAPNKEAAMTPFYQKLQQHTAQAQQQMLQAPVIEQVMSGAISKPLYIAFLTQAYHHVKHTVPLLMACGGRLSGQYEWVREALAEYIDEEKGHQEWILNDIRACGGDAIAVKSNLGEGKAERAIELMVAYLYHQIDRHNPLALFGMVWVLEGTSVGIGGQMAQQIQRTLQLPSEAMSYLTSHSVLDQSHLQFFERLMNQITVPNDQQVIIDSANMVFSLYGEMLRTLAIHAQQQAA